MIKLFGILLLSFLLTSCLSTQMQQDSVHEDDKSIALETEQPICEDVSCFKNRVLAKGQLSPTELNYFFDRVNYQDKIIRIMNRPGTSNPWYIFKQNNVSSLTINQGIQFYKKNKATLENVAQQYGIPAEYIVAILGIETRYGVYKGNDSVADALYTLAFHYPRRAKLFQDELEQFLLMSQEAKRDPFSYLGSFAGAMGLPQFMPSSYRQWALSYSGNSFADIWNNETDAIISIANYFKSHGWKTKQPVVFPVELKLTDELKSIIDAKTALNYTVEALQAKGVIFSRQLDPQEPVILFSLEIEAGIFKYYVGFNNFYTIWKYNNSRMYVMAVEEIAQGIKKGISQ